MYIGNNVILNCNNINIYIDFKQFTAAIKNIIIRL